MSDKETIDFSISSADRARKHVVFMIASHLAKTLVDGPTAIYPPGVGAGRTPWVIQIIQLTKYDEGTDPLHSLAIYALPRELRPGTRLPVLLRSEWNRSDLRRAYNEESLAESPLRSELFGVHEEELSKLDSLLQLLSSRLSLFPFEFETASPGVEVDDDVEGKTMLGVRSAARHSDLDLAWSAGSSPSLDAAWSTLWEELTNLCTAERAVQGWLQSFDLPPEKVARILLQSAEELIVRETNDEAASGKSASQ